VGGRDAVVAYIEQCEEDFALHDEERGAGIDIGLGQNACPAVLLYHPSGHTAVVRCPCRRLSHPHKMHPSRMANNNSMQIHLT
jgi:hypothetical protein